MNRLDGQLRRSRGFTLLEMLVAMSMVAIIASALYASFSIAYKARASAEAVIEPSRAAELAMEFLRNDLQNAIVPDTAFQASNSAFPVFVDSTGNDLYFYTTADARDHLSANGEIKLIELPITTPQGSQDKVLVQRITRNLLAQAPLTPVVDEEILCRGVANFTLTYFDGSQWQPSWDSTQPINPQIPTPQAVMVSLDLLRPDSSGQLVTYHSVRVFPLACTPPGSQTLNLGGM